MGDEARRAARRAEREARRKEREAEDAGEDERKKQREERRRKKTDDEAPAPAEDTSKKQAEEEEAARKQREADDAARKERERAEKEEREKERQREREREEKERAKREDSDRAKRRADAAAAAASEPVPTPKTGGTIDKMPFDRRVRILTALTEELYKIVEERENKVIPLSKEEQDEYETKLRNFRVQLRKAEETATELQKQKTELDAKLKKNDEEIQRCRRQLRSAEDEMERAIKEGKKKAPTKARPRRQKKEKAGGFASVVRKAQSAAWEEKFMKMREKAKGEQPEWAKKKKETINPMLLKGKSKEKGHAGDKPGWSSTGLRKAEKTGAGEAGKAKPEWQKKSLKKTEHGKELFESEDFRSRRVDWKVDLKRAEREKAAAGQAEESEPEWKKIGLKKVNRESDEED